MRPRLPAWTVLLILAAILAQGFYAAHLNRVYYAHFAPFFDSMAYMDFMAGILHVSKTSGIAGGLKAALGPSTVSLPWIIIAVLGRILPYSRLVGIWLQEFWMALLAISLLIYWRRYRGAPLGFALLWTVPPISFAAVYRANGGISDFRMDLSLYLLFSLTLIWYLATRETRDRAPWILSALFLALTCMNRATAPVYFAVTLGPLLVARFWLEPEKRTWLIRRVAAYWIPAAIIGLLPVAYNWSFVSYYYFTWNIDQNAALPLRQSAIHILFAGDNIGIPLAAAAAVLLAAQVANRLGRFSWRDVDWALVWTACAPALLLVLKGAGPNPFVSMPAVFGALLFCLAPFRAHSVRSRAVTIASVVVLMACGWVARAGYIDHAGPPAVHRPSIAALRTGIEQMRQECRRLGLKRAEFLTAHLGDFQSTALRNVLIYDLGAMPGGGVLQLPDGLALASNRESLFSPAAPVSWTEIPGATDADKYQHLVAIASAQIDFFFLPDEPSIGWLERTLPYNYINLKIRRLKREVLATGMWTKVGPPIRITSNETVDLYRNVAISGGKP